MWDEGKWERRALHIQRMEMIKRATAPVRLTQPSTTKIFDVMTTALTRNKAQLFPTRRRPKLRELDTDTEMTTIVEWFERSEIRIGSALTVEQKERAQRLLYTWREVFETDLPRIKRTDLIEHAIVLTGDAQPYRANIPLYSEQEIKFCQDLIPRMEEAGLIRMCDSAWGAGTKFVPKPRADTKPENDRF